MIATKENILEFLHELKPTLTTKGIQEIALFGSYAKNNTNIYSDIDIAIKKDKAILTQNSPYLYFEILNFIREKIFQKFHRKIDIFDLDSQSEFKNHIQKELIYV